MPSVKLPYRVRCKTCGFETETSIQPTKGVLLEQSPVDLATCPQCGSTPFAFDVMSAPFGRGPSQLPGLETRPSAGGIVVTQDAAWLAAEHGLDLSELAGSGQEGQIVLADVEAAVAEQDNQIAERMARIAGKKGE